MTQSAREPSDETVRLRRLESLEVLDTEPEDLFDAITRAAARIADVPIALITLVDSNRQWFKSNVGLDEIAETPRNIAFCAHAILEHGVLEVHDATQDERFSANPLVLSEPSIRFYAGAPLRLSDGSAIGTLCLIDRQPRKLSEAQREILTDLARSVSQALELRSQARKQQESIRKRLDSELELSRARLRHANILQCASVGTWEWNIQTGEFLVNDRWCEIIGRDPADLLNTPTRSWNVELHPDDRANLRRLLQRHFDGTDDYYSGEIRIKSRDGNWIWVNDRGRVFTRSADGKPLWMLGTRTDVSQRKSIEAELKRSQAFLDRTGRVAGVGGWELEIATGKFEWSDETRRIHEVGPDYVPTQENGFAFYAETERATLRSAVQLAAETGVGWDLEIPLTTARGRHMWVRSVGTAICEGGKPVRFVGAFQDIDARHRIEQALQEQYDLMQVTLNSITDAVITTNETGYIRAFNPAAERLTGWSQDSARHRSIDSVMNIINEQLPPASTSVALRCIAEQRTIAMDGEPVLKSRDGAIFGIDICANPTRDVQGAVTGAVVVFRDVTQQRRNLREVTRRAKIDTLTGLMNRSEFELQLSEALTVARERAAVYALMMIDLDHFKMVNDSCGHAAGDTLLQLIAQRMRNEVRDNDTIARLGGDEFVILMENCSLEPARAWAQSICDDMESFRFRHQNDEFKLGMSIGLVQLDASWSDAGAALKAADEACYSAKQSGRNCVRTK